MDRAMSPLKLFRTGAAALSGVLMLAACWLLIVQLLGPQTSFHDEGEAATQTLGLSRDTAAVAAQIALVRGRLWTEYAMSLAPFLLGGDHHLGDAHSRSLERAREAAVQAVHFAPFDARAWLLIAAVQSVLRDRNPASALKMSYYVGPNDAPLFPIRVAIATRSDALTDPDLRSLLGDEIQKTLEARPAFKPDILAAYRTATPEGKLFIEQEVGRADADLLAALRAAKSR
jgi:hypothetical protein